MTSLFAPSGLRHDRRSTLLFLIGAGMLVGGFLAPASQGTVATTLIILGAGQVAVAVLLPRMSEFEIGPGGLKTKLVDNDSSGPLIAADAERLNRFAHLMSGDPGLARDLVEEALGRLRLEQRRLAPQERGAFAVRTLVELLDTVDERRWLRGLPNAKRGRGGETPGTGPMSEILDALGGLEFPTRAAFLLRFDWPLRIEEVAALLDRPLETVRGDLEDARLHLRPQVKQVAD